jgi:hypothetical protein
MDEHVLEDVEAADSASLLESGDRGRGEHSADLELTRSEFGKETEGGVCIRPHSNDRTDKGPKPTKAFASGHCATVPSSARDARSPLQVDSSSGIRYRTSRRRAGEGDACASSAVVVSDSDSPAK